MVPRPPRERPHVLRVVALVCVFVGLDMLAVYAGGMWQGVQEQQHLIQAWNGEAATTKHYGPPVIDPSLQHPVNGVDFVIRVPRLNYVAAVKEGISSSVLYASPGHYPQPPWPATRAWSVWPPTTSTGSTSLSSTLGTRSTSR